MREAEVWVNLANARSTIVADYTDYYIKLCIVFDGSIGIWNKLT